MMEFIGELVARGDVVTLSAQVVAELVAAGLSGGALVAACRRIERADGAQQQARSANVVPLSNAKTVAFNSRKNATVAPRENATVALGAGAGRSKLAILRSAIANTRGISRAASLVGAAILDRFDPTTGRCEIGVAAISRVCGLHRASVFRALSALETAGLFTRVSYGGMGHCNAYLPRFVEKAGRQHATVGSTQPSQGCDPISDKNITTSDANRGAVKRKVRQSVPDRRQGHLPLPLPGGLSQPSFRATPDQLRAKAAQRLLRALNERHGGRAIRPDPEAWEAGIQAEMRNSGSGLDAHDGVLFEALGARRRVATGPP